MLDVDIDLDCALNLVECDPCRPIGEFTAELAQLNSDAVDVGDITEAQSGGLVVQRCTDGLLTAGAWPGGLQALDSTLRWFFDTLDLGSIL